jgi:hypothetical protein
VSPFSSPRSASRETKSCSAPQRSLQVFVLFNGKETTAAALRSAEAFVSGLGGEIHIAVPHVVPYPLPLNRPPVDRGVLLAQIAGAVAQSGITCGVRRVLIAYTRSQEDAWRFLLPPHCIVFIGRPKRSPVQRFRTWLSTKALAKLGHETLVA